MKKLSVLALVVLMLCILGFSAVAADPLYVNGTNTAEGEYATLEAAMEALPDEGGEIIVCGDTTVGDSDTTVELPAKSGKVTVTGEGGAKLTIGRGMRLGCEMEFDDIELANASSGLGYISARGHKLTIGENVTTSAPNSNTRYLTIYGSTDGSDTTAYNTHVIVKAGTWRHIFGGGKGVFNGESATIEVSGVTVTGNISGKNETKDFNGTATFIVDLRGDKTVTAGTFKQTPTEILVDEGYLELKEGNTYKQVKKAEEVITVAYVNGTNPVDGEYATLEAALLALADEGGEIIICGDTTIGDSETRVELPAKSGKVTVTGEGGAKLLIARGVCLGCDMEFDDIELVNPSKDWGYISAQGHELTIGENVTTSAPNSNNRYLTIYGSTDGSDTTAYNTHVIVKSGTWRHIFGGGKGVFNGETATLEVSNITVTGNISGKNEQKDFNGTADFIVDLRGNKTVTAGTFKQSPTEILVDEGYEAQFDGNTYSQLAVVRVNGTNPAEGEYTSLIDAIEALPDAGGNVIVTGDVATEVGSNLTLPAKSGKVTITAENGAKFINGCYSLKLSSEVEFNNIEIVNNNSAWGAFLACGNKLTFGEGVTTSCGDGCPWYPYIYGGDTGSVTTDYDSELVVKGGNWCLIYGGHHQGTFNGNSTVTVSDINVSHRLSANTESGTTNGTYTLILDLTGGKTVTSAAFLETPTCLVDEGYKAILDGTTYRQVKNELEVAYVDGTGATEGAYTTLDAAVEMLVDNGGTVIVCGDTTVGTSSAEVKLPAKSGKVTIIGENGAKLKIARGIVLGGETEFDDIELVNVSSSEGYIAADGNLLTIGEYVTTDREGTDRWLTVLGGNKTSEATDYDTHLIIKAGTYRYIYGGNSKSSFNGNSTVEVSNVTASTISAKCESGSFNGTATLIVDLCGDKTVIAAAFAQTPTVLVDEGYAAAFVDGTYLQRKTVIAYVSASTGEDDNSGLSDAAPKKTLGAYGENGVSDLVKYGGIIVVSGDLLSDDYTWNLNGTATVTAVYGDNNYKVYSDGTPTGGYWALADGAELTVCSNLILDNMIFAQSGESSTIHVKRAVFAITDTVDLVSAGGEYKLIVDENSIAVLSEEAQAFFTVEGDGEVVTYDAAEGVVIPDAYMNGSLTGIYNSEEYVKYAAESVVPSMRYEDATDLEAWKSDVTAKLNELLGLPLKKCDDDLFRIVSKTEYTDYTCVEFEFQSEPGYFVSATMFIPAGAVGELPCVITLSGHTSDDTVAVQAVQNGMIAVAFDQRYTGAAGQNSSGKAICQDGETANTLLYGRTAVGERVWDVQRLIDVLYTHFDGFVDEENLICIGNSIGGTTAFYAACLDERITISVPASAVCTYEDSVIANNPCRCYIIPGFEKYFDMGDLGALIAPRKLIVVSGNSDSKFPIAGANDTFAMIQAAYETDGVGDNCTLFVTNGDHGFWAEEVWALVDAYLEDTTTSSTATAADITVSTDSESGVEKIYNSIEYIRYIGRTEEPLMRYQEGEDFDEWRTEAKAKLTELLGLPLEKCDEDLFRIISEVEYDTYTRIDFEFQSEENYFVRATILIPAGATGKLSCAITLQGHTTGKHISLGEVKFNGDATHITESDFAIRAVREGVIGVAIEQRYMGTAGQSSNGTSACLGNASLNSLSYGRTAIGERVWDVSRTIDILEKYFDDQIDFEKLMCIGNSGGGTATYYASCLEDRIKISVPSCAVSTFYDSIVTQWHCRCNYVPGVAKYFDMGDLGMLIAPRKLLLVNGSVDDIFPIDGAREQYAIIESAYELLNASENCNHLIGNGGHRFYPDDAWPILHTYLGNEVELYDTVYVDGTGKTEGAFTNLGEALSKLSMDGGTVVICGDTAMEVGETLSIPAKNGKITITSENGAKLFVGWSIKLSSEVEFDNIELVNNNPHWGAILACGNKLTIGEGVTTSLGEGIPYNLYIYGGDTGNVTTDYDSELVVKGGNWCLIYGGHHQGTFNGNSTVTVSDINVSHRLSANTENGTTNGTYTLTLDLTGGKTVTSAAFLEEPVCLVDDGYMATKEGNTYMQVLKPVEAPSTVYVDPTGAKEGSYTTLEAAMNALPDEGGNVIIVSDVVVDAGGTVVLPAKNGKVTITSENGATYGIGWMLKLSSEVEFDDIELVNYNPGFGAIIACGNKLTIGEGVTTSRNGANWYPYIYGGDSGNTFNGNTELVLKGGTWCLVYGGNHGGTLNGNSTVVASDITVTHRLSANTEGGTTTGTYTLTLDLTGGKTVTSEAFLEEPVCLVDEGYKAVLEGTTYKQVLKPVEAPTTVYVDPTGATEGSYVTLIDAMNALADEGGNVIIVSDVATEVGSNITLPAKSGKVTITAENGAKFINGCYYLKLSSETEFNNIEIVNNNSAWGAILACGNKLTMGEGVTTSRGDGCPWYPYIYGGDTGNVTSNYDTELVLKGGTWCLVYGGNHGGTLNGNSTVVASDITVTHRLSANTEGGTTTGTYTLTLDLTGGKTVTSEAFLEEPVCLVDEGYKAVLEGTTYMQTLKPVDAPTTVYVDPTGAKEGSYATLEAAMSALADEGGNVIIVSDVTVDIGGTVVLPKKNGKVTITAENGATYGIGYMLKLSSEVEFDNIELVNYNPGFGAIIARGNKLTIGEGVTTSRNGAEWYPYIYGGDSGNTLNGNTELVIKSGTWCLIYGGNHTGTLNGNSTVTVSNINVTHRLSANTESGTTNGTYTLTLDLTDGKTVTSAAFLEEPVCLVDEGYEAVLEDATYKQVLKPVEGDFNGDGQVTIMDVMLALNALLNNQTLENSDMNGDGEFSLIDVLRVLKQIVK